MSYHGKVKPGSPGVHELTHLAITKASVGPMDNNAYLLICRDTDDAVLIDAAAEPDVLLGMIGDRGLSRIITTHRHQDHWGALEAVQSATGAETVAGAEDVSGIPVRTDRPVSDGDTIEVGNCTLEVVHLVGHTPGSIALLYDDPTGAPHLFTGDSLFPGGVGNTHNNPDNFTSLINDVETKLFDRLPDETWVYPGHGDDTTLGKERPHLGEWRQRGW
jgi:glyoxylase-like metal-dependent hydrolase (beta-lactamase superfamily II)